MLFCNRMCVYKSKRVPPFTFFGTTRHFPKEKFFSKISSFFQKNVLRFLRLRYSADLRRSRLVDTCTPSSNCYNKIGYSWTESEVFDYYFHKVRSPIRSTCKRYQKYSRTIRRGTENSTHENSTRENSTQKTQHKVKKKQKTQHKKTQHRSFLHFYLNIFI